MKNTIDFYWTGINAYGQKTNGKINTITKQNAIRQLINDGITILSIKKNKSLFYFLKEKKFNAKELLDFTQQLLLLLQAGIPLSDALRLIIQTTKNTTAKSVLENIDVSIKSGATLAAALSRFPAYFNQQFCNMINAGEQSGHLEGILVQLIHHQEKSILMRNTISKALFYPLSVLCIAMIISVGLLIFVIPQFSTIYANFGAQLPLMTQQVIALSAMLKTNGLFYLSAIIITTFIAKKYFLKNRRMPDFIDQFALYMPFLKSLIITKYIAQWSHVVSMALSSRMPLIDALQMANETMTHSLFHRQLIAVKEAVIAGQSLHTALAAYSYFPERAKYLIAIGENADALDKMTAKIAILYQQQLFDTLDRLSKLVEPVIMIVVASLVSGLIVAMYLPIFRMGGVI